MVPSSGKHTVRRRRRTFMQMRKQEDICGRGVPALNSVGLACVNQRSLSSWYVWMAASRSSWWMPTCLVHK